MGIRSGIKEVIRRLGYVMVPLAENQGVYNFDGLISIHDHDFMNDKRFRRAYERGVEAAGDYHWYWRVHIGLWAASTASKLEGDFAECGVNRGFLSSAIMNYLDWGQTGKTFYLLDTFAGLDSRQMDTDGELERNTKHLSEGFYVTDLEAVKRNFAEWSNVKIIQGPVPDTLEQIDSERLAFLHLDMNAAAPEAAAFEVLWEKLVPGAMLLMDDYAFHGYSAQKQAMDAVASKRSVEIAALPTGQGLIVKPR